jgi:hypothetical protein
MMIDIDANEFTNSPCPPEFAELRHKLGRESCQTNDGSIDIHDKSVRAVNFSAGGQADV